MSWKSISYKLHRRLGLIILIPVFFWVISGLMHPFMAHWFKPDIEKTFLFPQPVELSAIRMPLRTALTQNKIAHFDNSRLIKSGGTWYYQVAVTEDSLVYLHAQTGEAKDGVDKQYAEELARTFLGDRESPIKAMTLIKDYTFYYREINRLLPVWKISFDRPDGMDIYVETKSSRLGTYSEKSRTAFIWFFNVFHNWEFIPGPLWLRTTLMVLISGLVFITALIGLVIYGFNRKTFKKIKKGNSILKKRKQHRVLGLTFSLFMFMFSFSGWYHAVSKYKTDNRNAFYDQTKIKTTALNTDIVTLIQSSKKPVLNFSMATFDGEHYYRILLKGEHFPVTEYRKVSGGSENPAGENAYAKALAVRFTQMDERKIKEILPVTEFKGEYGFVNKRLPVMKVRFDVPDNEAAYIETSTGKLAARVNDNDRAEGYSFAFLHKYHFLDGLGRNFRDIVMMLGAASLVLIAVLGYRIAKK